MPWHIKKKCFLIAVANINKYLNAWIFSLLYLCTLLYYTVFILFLWLFSLLIEQYNSIIVFYSIQCYECHWYFSINKVIFLFTPTSNFFVFWNWDYTFLRWLGITQHIFVISVMTWHHSYVWCFGVTACSQEFWHTVGCSIFCDYLIAWQLSCCFFNEPSSLPFLQYNNDLCFLFCVLIEKKTNTFDVWHISE